MISSAIARGREEWARATLADALGIGICVGAFGLALTAAKLLHGLPGHAVAFWLPTLMVARWVRPKAGSAALTAFGGGMLFSAFPRFGPGQELYGYLAGAAVVELFAWRRQPTLSVPVALTCGMAAGLAKYAARLGVSFLGLPAKWVLADVFSRPLVIHIISGAIGAMLAWLILRGAARLRRTPE